LLRYDLKTNDIYNNIIFREIAQMISLLALQFRDTLERHVKVIMIWTGRVVREAEHLPIPAGESRALHRVDALHRPSRVSSAHAQQFN
jgi:hypothetical protein